MSNILFTAYCTPSYEPHMKRLEASMEKYHLNSRMWHLGEDRHWLDAVNLKPTMIQMTMEQHPDKVVVYVDADAEVVAYPEWLLESDLDTLNNFAISAHTLQRRGGLKEILSGTLVFWPNRLSRELLATWKNLCEAQPDKWDQKNLQEILDNFPSFPVLHMPAAYCQIFDTMAHCGDPVILHHQASRALPRTAKKRIT